MIQIESHSPYLGEFPFKGGQKKDIRHYDYEKNVLIRKEYLTQIYEFREGFLGKAKSEFSCK